MRVKAVLKCWRLSTATNTFPRPRPLSSILFACEAQRRGTHTSSRHRPSTVPPPLTTTPLHRRAATCRKQSARLATPAHPAAGTSTIPSWTDVLALRTSAGTSPAPSRVALREAAALCLTVESPKCYSVYRPCDSGDGSGGHARAAPHQFVELLGYMRTAPNLSREARRVAEVLVDLLNKAPHPHLPGPWDVTSHQVRVLKANAIAHAMNCVVEGDDALHWLVELLGLSDTFMEVDAVSAASVQPAALLKLAVTERIERRDGSSTPRTRVVDPDGDWLLSTSSAVVGAIAGAMLRSATDGARVAALELLEAAALSRLTRSASSVLTGDAHPAVAQPAESVALFNEAVAVHCAEVAAVRGDVETVARLIFLLYRARGALGFPTLAEHRQQRLTGQGSSSSSGDGAQRWTVGRLLPRTPAWMRTAWWGGAAAFVQAVDLAEGDDADLRFEQAVVRLLKSVMHAALYHPLRSGDPGDGNVKEALSLWDGLRGGTSWSGLAAMATELLTYLVDQHALVAATAAARDDCSAAEAQRLQQAGLLVYTQLARAVPPRHRTTAQRDVLNHCISLMVQLLSTSISIAVERDAAAIAPGPACLTVPSVVTSSAAEQILRLFAHVSDAAHQEMLLPYALAASLTLLSTATTLKSYHLPASLFSSLARYFSEVQSLHFYCAAVPADASPTAPHVAVCGSLILLHVFLFLHTPLGSWAHEDGELWSFVQRFCNLGSAVGNVDGGGRQREGHGALLLSWLRVSAKPQRQLLWSLMMSLRRRDGRVWCGATRSLFTSPASSVAVFAAADATYPALSTTELRAVMALLYECGNTADPVHACATLDRVVTAATQIPIHTLTPDALVEQLQPKSASGARPAVLVLTAASLRVMAQRPALASDGVSNNNSDCIADLVRLLHSLLRESPKHPGQHSVLVILTPACLLELQRLRAQDIGAQRHDSSGIIQSLHASLTGTVAHKDYRVAVAAAWPLLPSLAAALRQHSELCADADGLREVTAAARHLEEAFPREVRPVVCLWAEEDTALPTSTSLTAIRLNLLQHYGAREVSTHRARVEKAKSDIFSLLSNSPMTDIRRSDMHVSTDVAAAELNAARRMRNRSLLSAVSPKRKDQQTL